MSLNAEETVMSIILRLTSIALLLPLAAQSAEIHVPDDLQDWQGWVLQDKEYRDCPLLFDRSATSRDDFVCAWPGLLELSVNAEGGRFSQVWTAYADEQWVSLPGSAEFWPAGVTVDGRTTEVVMHRGHPSILLGPGRQRITGSFEWDQRPPTLHIPPRSGLIRLSVDGRQVQRPERNNAGLFLGERKSGAKTRDAVSTQIYRLVMDDVPTRLVTQLQIDVSGGVREELFGPLLPEGFVPLAIGSQLPARLEPDGKLLVQVRPGRWIIELRARAADVLNAISLPAPDVNLPGEEIWSYRANDRLRVTAAEGVPPVDPRQVQVPGQWQQLPAYRVRAGDTFTLVERSRGIVSADNQLSLNREMWLDFDGDGFVVNDEIGGSMRTNWRLDMTPPFSLLSASENDQSLLITLGDEEGETGVELRQRDVALAGLGRADTRKSMPVTGWDARFAGVSTTLHLPPGHKLLAARGADHAPTSWAGRWQLLDFFLVLIITIAAWRLFGRTAGIIALVALVLSFHEPVAPSWLWLNMLVAVALLRVAPQGRLRQGVRSYQLLSAAALVLAMVPFLASQLRIAIYPQLEPQGRSYMYMAQEEADLLEPGLAGVRQDAPAATMERRVQAPERAQLEEIAVSAAKAPVKYARYAPNAIVQAGPGIPSWAWNTYDLEWGGPVDADQAMRLVILPRWAVTTLRFIEVIALLLFAAVFAAEVFERKFRLPGGLTIGRAGAGSFAAAGLLGLLLSASPVAEAQTPSPEILNELETRLTAPPECAPRCAEIATADVEVSANSVSMRLTVHTLEDVAVPLPGSDQGWRPDAIVVDGSSAAQVFRGKGQELWLRFAPGRHTVVLSGAVPEVDSLEIPFPTPPRVITADGQGWFIAGIKDRRLLSGSLQLTRLQTDADGDATVRWESSRFPAFVRVERAIDLDLDWRVTTTVFRVAPQQGAISLEVPLLDGESVLTEGVRVEGDKALLSMNPNQRSVSWRSNLERVSPLVLEAKAGAPWKEVWWIGVGSVWHAEFSGIPESENPAASHQIRTAEFYPRGGESLTIQATRPDAVEGSTLAFDAANLLVEHGVRSTSNTLELDYRSTRGAQHILRLAEDAEVTRVSIDGRIEPLRADAGALTVPILPGEHDIQVEWRTGGDIGLRAMTPVVDIGAPASNITLESSLPRNRWLLATSGPKLGPAVLYWSELLVLILFAVILGRIRLTPLKTHHWLLLGVGFSTFNWPVLGIVVLWLLACGVREQRQGETNWWQFNLIQVAIGGATVVALISIVTSLPMGLLGSPNMHVTGFEHFGGSLKWFDDSSSSVLPQATAWSVPMWIYKTLILAWALWLSFALIRWLPWVWQCFSSQGYWKPRTKVQS